MGMYAILGGIDKVANYIVLALSKHYQPARTSIGGVAVAYHKMAQEECSDHLIMQQEMPCLIAAVLDDMLYGNDRMRMSAIYHGFKHVLAVASGNLYPEEFPNWSTLCLTRNQSTISSNEVTILKILGIEIDQCRDLLGLFVSMLDFQLDYVNTHDTIHQQEAPEDPSFCGLVQAHNLRFHPGSLHRMGGHLHDNLYKIGQEIVEIPWMVPPQYMAEVTIMIQCFEEKLADLEKLIPVFEKKGGRISPYCFWL